jgi:hypothetical protein
MGKNTIELFEPERIYDPEQVDAKLNDDQIRYLIFSLQEMIKNQAKEIQDLRQSIARDKADQWFMISELTKKVDK